MATGISLSVRVERHSTVDESAMQGHLTQLVEELVARHAMRSEPVRRAFLAVPRHLFVPETLLDAASMADRAIPTLFDERGVPISSSSAPCVMAIMLELLGVACASDQNGPWRWRRKCWSAMVAASSDHICRTDPEFLNGTSGCINSDNAAAGIMGERAATSW
jgi:hypothetical protein